MLNVEFHILVRANNAVPCGDQQYCFCCIAVYSRSHNTFRRESFTGLSSPYVEGPIPAKHFLWIN